MTPEAAAIAWRAYEAAVDRHVHVLDHLGATCDAIRENRPFSRLSQKPYDPFRDSDPQAAAPPPPRTCCVDCWGTGLIRTGDGWNEPLREEYCCCAAGLELEDAEAEELARMEAACLTA